MAFPDLVALSGRAVLSLLGGPVTYEPEAGGSVNVRGVFDAAYVRLDTGQGGVSSTSPAVFVLLADLPVDPEEDDPAVTIGGTEYRVREVQKDGQGGAVLLLHKAMT